MFITVSRPFNEANFLKSAARSVNDVLHNVIGIVSWHFDASRLAGDVNSFGRERLALEYLVLFSPKEPVGIPK